MDNNELLLARRNTATVEQKLRDFDNCLQTQTKQIVELTAAVTTLIQRVSDIETNFGLIRAKSFGTGPSVK